MVPIAISWVLRTSAGVTVALLLMKELGAIDIISSFDSIRNGTLGPPALFKNKDE